MASKAFIAAQRERALYALQESSKQIAAVLNIEPPDLSPFFRDADLLQSEQLKNVAAFQASIVDLLQDYQAEVERARADVEWLRSELEALQQPEAVEEAPAEPQPDAEEPQSAPPRKRRKVKDNGDTV